MFNQHVKVNFTSDDPFKYHVPIINVCVVPSAYFGVPVFES